MFQHPIIPLIFSVITVIVVIKQCFISHKFLKGKVILTFLMAFISVLIYAFYDNLKEDELLINVTNWGLIVVDVIIGLLIISTINYSHSKDTLQAKLTNSINQTKYYVLLDKKDRITDISDLFLNDLNLKKNDVLGKNFYDILESKYYIIAFNNVECSRKDIKKYYNELLSKLNGDTKSTMELELMDNNKEECAFYFEETFIISSNDKYKGKILFGDKKNEETLIGMENQINKTSKELDIIRSRFVTILEKTSEGIFFNDLKQKFIWFNDYLVNKLALPGNTIDQDTFLSYIHPDDLALYNEKMKQITSNDGDYAISYRFFNGTSFNFIKEEGSRISCGKAVELCGIMTVIDNYKFAKTDTLLDNIQTEPEMLARLNTLINLQQPFLAIHFELTSIPEINDKYGRAIGNLMINDYVDFIKTKFVNDNQIYRISGLEFVAFITDLRKMDILKNNLANNDKMLHVPAKYMNDTITTDVHMGIAYSTDSPNPKDIVANASKALKFTKNKHVKANYIYYREL